jgi:hypothetical protein
MGRKLAVILAAAILTTEGAPAEPIPAEPTPAEPAPAEPTPAEPTPPAEDLATLFSPEEIQAQRVRVAAAKAEETRRAGLTEEQRAEEDRLKAEAEAAGKVPEEYADFTAPEGMTLDGEALTEFKAIAKELGLNQVGAQKLVDIATKMQIKTMDGLHEIHEQRKASWLQAAKEDEEIGADVKLWNPDDPNSASASVSLRAFNSIAAGVPGIKAMVDELGIGNHPDFIRVFYRIGKNMREDSFEGIGGSGGKGDGGSVAKSLWPNMN